MKFKMYMLLLAAAISTIAAFAQPVIGLQRTIGGGNEDEFSSMSFTKDNGLIIGGSSNSDKSGEKSANSKGSYDFWILLLNSKGAIRGQRTIGGSNNDYLSAVEQTIDGGYILGGFSNSDISGNKTENSRGTNDYWIVKLDSNANIQWDQTIGGSSDDELKIIMQTNDGGYIAGGNSFSNASGEKTGNSRGAGDYWVVKLDGSGNIQWEKTIGGNYVEYLKDIIQTKDGGYLVGGESGSPASGEKTDSSRGSTDYWIVKLDNAGNIQWDKTYGGRNADGISAMLQTPDGGYLLAGNSSSRKSGEKMQQPRGEGDYWVIKTDSLGQIGWSNIYGGDLYDNCNSLQPTSDGGYILGGTSLSNIFAEKTENSRGRYDYWVVKINQDGTKQWDKTIGGTSGEFGGQIKEIGNNSYVVAGHSWSGIGGDKIEENRGPFPTDDYWLVLLKYTNPDGMSVAALPNSLQVNTDKNNKSFTVYPNPAKDVLHIQTTGKNSFILTSQSGETVLTKTITNSGSIDVSKLRPGVYLLVNKNTGVSQKVVISK